MLSKSIRRRVTQGMVCAMLFAQAALAVAACDWLRVAPAQAILAKAGEPSCHEQPAQSANLCLAHCLGNDQSTVTPHVAIPVWSQSSLLVIVDFDCAPALKTALHYTLPHPGAPPPRILFQTFLI